MTERLDRITALTTNPLLKKGDEIVSPDWSTTQSVDILRAYVDISLLDNYDDISLDDTTIIEHMRSEGMTDAQIAACGIHVSSRLMVSGDETTWGQYSAGSKDITLYPNGHTHEYSRTLLQYLALHIDEAGAHITNGMTQPSERMSETLYHEIRHAKQDVVDGNFEQASWQYTYIQKMQYLLGSLASVLVMTGIGEHVILQEGGDPLLKIAAPFITTGWAFLSILGAGMLESARQYKDYRGHPLEVDARNGGELAPENVVNLVPKTHTVTMTRERMNGVSRRELLLHGLSERALEE